MIQTKKRLLNEDTTSETNSDTQSNVTGDADSTGSSVGTVNFVSIKDPRVHRRTNRSLFAIKNSFVMNGIHDEDEVKKMIHLLLKSEKEASIYAVMEMIGFLRDVFVNTNKGNSYTEIDHERKRLKGEVSLIKAHVLRLNTLINKTAWSDTIDAETNNVQNEEEESAVLY